MGDPFLSYFALFLLLLVVVVLFYGIIAIHDIPYIIDVEDDMSGYQIPLGAAGMATIYTEHWHHVSLLRKILLRMRSWQNYVFLEGH
jgi:hypothetical protein